MLASLLTSMYPRFNAPGTFPAPGITIQPSPQSVASGATATFTVVDVSHRPTFYQWQVNPGTGWVNVSGGTIAITNTSLTDLVNEALSPTTIDTFPLLTV